MKYLFSIILLILISSSIFSQKKIYLKSIYEEDIDITRLYGNDVKYKKKIDFLFYNLSDTTFLSIYRHEDMGSRGPAMLVFKDSIPNGRYYIFIDSLLHEEVSYKNYKRDSTRILYISNGEKEMYTYKNGRRSGYYKKFYSDGKLMTFAKIDSIMPIRTYLYKSGKVKTREYRVLGKCVRVESFTEDGEMEYLTNNGLQSSNKKYYKKDILNGRYILKYKEGKFKIKFKENKILNWRFFDSNGKLLLEETGIINKEK